MICLEMYRITDYFYIEQRLLLMKGIAVSRKIQICIKLADKCPFFGQKMPLFRNQLRIEVFPHTRNPIEWVYSGRTSFSFLKGLPPFRKDIVSSLHELTILVVLPAPSDFVATLESTISQQMQAYNEFIWDYLISCFMLHTKLIGFRWWKRLMVELVGSLHFVELLQLCLIHTKVLVHDVCAEILFGFQLRTEVHFVFFTFWTKFRNIMN